MTERATDPERALAAILSSSEDAVMAANQSTPGTVDLWAAEAAHRVNNLAQLAGALASYHRRRGICDLTEVEQVSQDLAGLYVEIGAVSEDGALLPCEELMRRLVTDLVVLFGPITGAVAAHIQVDPLSLEASRRRSLLLIASELVINALRHAFPNGGGFIDVGLTCDGTTALLSVCDDGVGFAETPSSGNGSRLVAGLAATLGGRVDTISPAGRGTKVTLTFFARPPPTVTDLSVSSPLIQSLERHEP